MKMRMIWNLFIQVQLVVSLILPVNCWPVLRNLDVSVLLESLFDFAADVMYVV